MKVHEPVSGAALVLSHVKGKMSAGIELRNVDRLGAMSATAAELRESYGPTIKTTEPPETRLPETVKGAIASASG